MIATIAVFFALFGFAVGSFLNVCIDRLPNGKSLVRPASHCAFGTSRSGFGIRHLTAMGEVQKRPFRKRSLHHEKAAQVSCLFGEGAPTYA